TWMMRIVMNLAISHRGSRRPTVPLEEAQLTGPADGPAGVRVAGPGGETLKGQVRRAVQSLPPRQRQVLILKVYEEMKFTEVAAAMGISVGTAKAAFFQAVRGLRKRLAVDESGGCGEEEVGA